MKEVHSSTTPNSKIQFHFAFCKFASLTGTCPLSCPAAPRCGRYIGSFHLQESTERNDPEALKQECNIFHMMFESLIDLQKKLAEIHSKFPSDLCS
jgi:hypothetical protein